MLVSVSLIILALSIWVLWSWPAQARPPFRGSSLSQSGPLIDGFAKNLSLDGLTIVPTHNMLPLRFCFRLPFDRVISVYARSSAGSMIFKTLRVARARVNSKNAGQLPVTIQVDGFETDISLNLSTRTIIELSNLSDGHVYHRWQYRGDGQIAAKVADASVAVSIQLVQLESSLRLAVVSNSISFENLDGVNLVGFGWGGKLATMVLPYIKHTAFVSYPLSFIFDLQLRAGLENEGVDRIIGKIASVANVHVDLDRSWTLSDDKRDSIMSNLGSETAIDPLLTQTTKNAPEALVLPHFDLAGSLFGSTLLHTFPIADFKPSLYPPGSARAFLQSFNLVTNEIEFSLTQASMRNLSYTSALVFIETDAGGGVLTIKLVDLRAELVSKFDISAETSGIVAWTTGVPRIGESGDTKTLVIADEFVLRFIVSRATLSLKNEFILTTASISPFTSITPSFTVTKLPKVGAELVNSLSAMVSPQIAAGASFIIRHFVEKEIRNSLQGVIDGVEEKLREGGVELPSSMRNE